MYIHMERSKKEIGQDFYGRCNAQGVVCERYTANRRADVAATSWASSLPSPLTVNLKKRKVTHARILDISADEADENCQDCVGEGGEVGGGKRSK